MKLGSEFRGFGRFMALGIQMIVTTSVIAGIAALVSTPAIEAASILERLRGHTSGLAVPHLAVDLPGGAGKVTVQPQYLLGSDGAAGHWFRSYRGERVHLPEPPEADCSCPYDEVFYAGGPG